MLFEKSTKAPTQTKRFFQVFNDESDDASEAESFLSEEEELYQVNEESSKNFYAYNSDEDQNIGDNHDMSIADLVVEEEIPLSPTPPEDDDDSCTDNQKIKNDSDKKTENYGTSKSTKHRIIPNTGSRKTMKESGNIMEDSNDELTSSDHESVIFWKEGDVYDSDEYEIVEVEVTDSEESGTEEEKKDKETNESDENEDSNQAGVDTLQKEYDQHQKFRSESRIEMRGRLKSVKHCNRGILDESFETGNLSQDTIQTKKTNAAVSLIANIPDQKHRSIHKRFSTS